MSTTENKTIYTGLGEHLKKSERELGMQTYHAKIHPNDKCGINGLPLTPNSIRIYGRFQYLKTLKHANLCKYIDIERSNQQRIFVIIENFTLKLTSLLSDSYLGNIILANSNLVYKWLYEILLAIKYLHDRSIIIRNLNVNNILIDANGCLKLTNHGLFYMTEYGSCVDFHIGTCLYTPPEVYLEEYILLNDNFDGFILHENLNNPKSDVWSFGILAFTLIFNINMEKYENIKKKQETIIADMLKMLLQKTETNFYGYLVNLFSITSDQRDTVEKRWKVLVQIIKKSLEIDVKRRVGLNEILYAFDNDILSKIFTKDQAKSLFFNSNIEHSYDLVKIFESQFDRLLHITATTAVVNQHLNKINDEPLLERSIDEIYYLWRLVGGDFMSILKHSTKNMLKLPSIKKSYLLCKFEDSSEYGTPENEETKFDDKIISIPLTNLLRRLKGLNKESYYPLINETETNDLNNSDILKLTSTQPLSIRETDIEYQFHRLMLFSRYLSAYPYKKTELYKECRIDIPPFYRNLIWAALLEVNCNVNDVYSSIDKEQITNADRQIDVDIPRCHQYDALIASPDAHIKLKRILKAWVVTNTNLTYWQGLDSLCAPFLYLNFNNEPLAYVCFNKFIEKYASKFFLKDNSAIIHEYLLVLSQLISFHDPELAIHFENIEFRPDLYAIPWFLTMFAHIFPIQKILHLWDTLLLGSVAFPLCIGGAILKQLRKLLLNSDFNECILLFSELPEINIEKCVLDSIALFVSTPKSCLHLQYVSDPITANRLDIDEINFAQRRLELSPRVSANDIIKLSGLKPHKFVLIDIRQNPDAEMPNVRNLIFENLDFTKIKTLIETVQFPCASETDANIQLLNILFQNKNLVKVIVSNEVNYNQCVELANEVIRLGFNRVCILHNTDSCLDDIIKCMKN